MTPQTSIIITVYNRDRYLDSTIQSVLAQTCQDFELIIWDDGSTDRSIEIAQAYAAQDERIRLIAAPHQGLTRSLKLSIAEATGTYVGTVDSDDLLAPTTLEATTALLNANPDVGMVYTNYTVIDEKGHIIGPGQRCTIPYSKDRLLVDFMTFHFRLIRQSIYQQIGGFDTAFFYAQDYDLCLKLSEVSQIQHLAQPLYFYRNHSQSISQEKRVEQIEYARRAIANALQRRGLSDRYDINVEIIGRFSIMPKS